MNDDLKFFNDGAAYERLMGRWSQLAGATFIDWLEIPQGLRWLDVGCGNGAFSELLMGHCPPSALHGVDLSDAQIAYARTRDALRNGEFRTGDAQSLPFDDNSFDVATMALVISFVPDPAKAVSEMTRVVRPGGWVASYMWDAPAGGLPAQPIAAGARALGLVAAASGIPGTVYSRADFETLWKGAGLEDVESCRIDIQTTYIDVDDFWESNTLLASPVTNMVKNLTTAGQERIKSYLAETLPKDGNGHITTGAFANAVKGRVIG